ncbi:MAG: sugar ABC transporter permease [Chloroflexi bacterium]|nr:sugar ABC transporter permease [Chloroflexota bacterium]
MAVPLLTKDASRTERPFWNNERRNFVIGILFISPWLIGFLLFTLIPLASSLYYSFTFYDLLRPARWIGLGNYVEIFTRDPLIAKITWNTLFYVGLGVPLGLVSAFLMATLLNTRIFGRSIFRAIFFFPSILPGVVVAMVWAFLLNTQYGFVNAILSSLNLPVIPFLSHPDLAKPSLIMINMWTQGATVVIFLATLQDVPRTLYEAATMDGANAWQKFWIVTVPMCTPAILFNLIMGLISAFQDFSMPYLLTGGGPDQATEFYSLYLYHNAFKYLRMGKASALAWIMFIAIVILTVILFRTSKHWVFYSNNDD